MSTYFKLSPSTQLEFENETLTIIVMASGFSGTGNKHAYEILNCMQKPATIEEIIDDLCKRYSESQHPRIKKSVPRVHQWALDHGIIEEVMPIDQQG